MDDGLPPIREVIRAHGIRAKKSLGQNFLNDFNLTRKIARVSGNLEMSDVLEIGPGPGGLTRALLAEGARHVVAIEADRRFLPVLGDVAGRYPGRLTVVHGDARIVDPVPALSLPVKIIANLPYGTGTSLLVDWLLAEPWPPFWSSMTLMFQKEVAERIVAAPGNRKFGRLSVLAQWRCRTRILFEIPREAFTPVPAVSSAVVHLKRHSLSASDADPSVDPKILELVTRLAFGQRRKMLRGSLKALAPDIGQVLTQVGISPEDRAESVPVERYCALCNAIRDRADQG